MIHFIGLEVYFSLKNARCGTFFERLGAVNREVVWRYQLYAFHPIRKPTSSASYTRQQAVVERGFDENLQQGTRYIRQPYKRLVSRVFAENFAAKLLQPPQRYKSKKRNPPATSRHVTKPDAQSPIPRQQLKP